MSAVGVSCLTETANKMTDLQNAAFCVIDIETTGLDYENDRICEIGFVITTMEKVIYAVDTLVDPGIPIPPEVTKIHHIVDRDVVGAPKEFPYGIKLPPRDCYVAHHAKFDSAFLPALSRGPWICTKRLARRVLPQEKKFGNQSLRHALNLDADLDLPPGARPHRALPDALVSAALLRHLLARLPKEAPDTVEGLAAWCNEPRLLEKCYFGKQHRGKPWSKVPKDYLEWMASSCSSLDADTRYTVAHYLGRPTSAA
jgi:exodeoxyribonuclease X